MLLANFYLTYKKKTYVSTTTVYDIKKNKKFSSAVFLVFSTIFAILYYYYTTIPRVYLFYAAGNGHQYDQYFSTEKNI